MPGIDVRIQAGVKDTDCSVKASGTVIHPITKKEINSFDVSPSKLREGVGKFHGKEPDRVALSESDDIGHLYNDYDWKTVQTVLKVKDAQMLEITSEPRIISTQPFINNSKKTGTFNANISQQVEQTTETNWSDTDTIEISQSFSYKVGFLGTGVGGETSMSYSHEFGRGGSESKAVTVSASQGVEVELDPGESVVCRLSASRGVMKVRIIYEATLVGDVAVDYHKGYKGHHYYAFDVGEIRNALGSNNPLEFTEDIEVGFFANATVQIDDYEDPDAKKDEKKEEEKEEPPKESGTLSCNGQPCEKCRKCHDWQFNGNQETWDWIRNFLSWQDADWDRWRDEHIGNGFVKREGAACNSVSDHGADGGGSARYLSYMFLIHICLCDTNPVSEGTPPSASEPCKVQ